MRVAFVILSLAAIAIGLLDIRRERLTTEHAGQQLQRRLIEQRRLLWDQDVRLGELKSLPSVRARGETWEQLYGLSVAPPGAPGATGPRFAQGQATD